MSVKNITVKIPTNPEAFLKLMGKIIEKHNEDPASSPLSALDMGHIGGNFTEANTSHLDAKSHRSQAEIATERRNLLLGDARTQQATTPGTLHFNARQVRDILMGVHKGNEQMLELWGFEVTTSGKAKTPEEEESEGGQ